MADNGPNVILIVMDATRSDRLSCYGYKRKTSENIDRLAAQATLYEQCIATASWTLPSLSSIFTGLYPKNHRVNSKSLVLRDSFTNLAELFQKAGYKTQAFSCNAWVGGFSGLDRGFEKVHDIWRGLEKDSKDAGASAANELALQWLDSIPKSASFFGFIHYMEPHFPYRPPEPFDRKFTNPDARTEAVERVRGWDSPRELGYILNDPGSSIDDEELEILQAQYDGEIAYLDKKIGELIAALSERKLLDKTVLIITADHGEHIGDHGLLDHKMSVYEGVIRVPLIIRFPDRFPAGQRITRMVQTIDLFPTLAELCGLDAIKNDGTSLLNSAQVKRTAAFTEFARPLLFIDVIEQNFPLADYSAINRALLSVRTERFKLIWASDDNHELYDLLNDPEEEKNLFLELPKEANRLLQGAVRFRTE